LHLFNTNNLNAIGEKGEINMTAFKGVNKTKYDAGGSGDNVILDGYIKSVEKIWMDSFAFTAVLTTADTVAIATIPKNKKITAVEVYFPTAMTPSSITINVGTVGDANKFISAAPVATSLTETGALVAVQKAVMNNPDGFQFVTTGVTDVFLSLSAAISAPTAGTITTVVKYT